MTMRRRLAPSLRSGVIALAVVVGPTACSVPDFVGFNRAPSDAAAPSVNQESDADLGGAGKDSADSSVPAVDAGPMSNGAQLYWAVESAGAILTANVEVGVVNELIGNAGSVGDIALAPDEGKIYWTDAGSNQVRRANLDGSSVESLVRSTRWPAGIVVNLDTDFLYWAEQSTDRIRSLRFTGSVLQTLAADVMSPGALAIAPVADKLYWLELDTMTLQRGNFDGSAIEDVIVDLDDPTDIVVDEAAGKIYWTELGTTGGQPAVGSSALDGTDLVAFVSTGLDGPTSLALDGERDQLYVLDVVASGGSVIYVISVDGSLTPLLDNLPESRALAVQ